MWYIAEHKSNNLTISDISLVTVIDSETLKAYYLSPEQALSMFITGEKFHTIGSYTRIMGTGGEPSVDTYSERFYDCLKYMKTLDINYCTNHTASDFVIDMEEFILTYNNDFSFEGFRRTVFKYNTETLVIREGIKCLYMYSFGVAYKVGLDISSVLGIYETHGSQHVILMRGKYGRCVEIRVEPGTTSLIVGIGKMSKQEFLRHCVLDWETW